ncbi:hypothetical protein P4O66_004432 [Electrophorus voltai]|uniref:Reverse transcriptase domain-containing protein n=1 Tax=Electrophorus voltai TaxID=2609070 RepID=A0AAD8ZNI2_9TELE|nr:hypothetical protein P4O66_004432 [Electrophorus voltai]
MSADQSLVNELNTFFARFEATSSCANASRANANSASANASASANGNGTIGTGNGTCAEPEQRPLIITESDVRRVFKRVKTRKAVGPDGICGRVLKACTNQLAPVFTDIFNLSLTLGIVPSSFKLSTIVPVPKKPRPSDLNDYHPVALTSVVMKCFEKLVRDFITSSLPASMDPLQFAYCHNRSTDDAIAHLLHTTLTHLDEGRGNYVNMLFVDYSSAFNTIIPSLLTKLEDLGLHTSLCDWISNFLTDRPQSVRVGNCASSTLTLSNGAPQGCVLSPLLYSLHTYDCTATSSPTIIVKFADNTVVMGLISDNDERAYLEEMKHLENWCQEKTKELIVDHSKKQERHYQPNRPPSLTLDLCEQSSRPRRTWSGPDPGSADCSRAQDTAEKPSGRASTASGPLVPGRSITQFGAAWSRSPLHYHSISPPRLTQPQWIAENYRSAHDKRKPRVSVGMGGGGESWDVALLWDSQLVCCDCVPYCGRLSFQIHHLCIPQLNTTMESVKGERLESGPQPCPSYADFPRTPASSMRAPKRTDLAGGGLVHC